jgi:hypothetical protein
MASDGDHVVPLIVVFTKIDRLRFREQRQLKKTYMHSGMDAETATTRSHEESAAAVDAKFAKSCVEVLQSDRIPKAWAEYCAVSFKGLCSCICT